MKIKSQDGEVYILKNNCQLYINFISEHNVHAEEIHRGKWTVQLSAASLCEEILGVYTTKNQAQQEIDRIYYATDKYTMSKDINVKK